MEMAPKSNSIAMGIQNLFMIILLKNKIFKRIPKSGIWKNIHLFIPLYLGMNEPYVNLE
jgi:hypothetical protein